MKRTVTAILLAVVMALPSQRLSHAAAARQGVGVAADSSQAGDVTTAPVVLREVQPSYTAAAMAAKQQGQVSLAITVRPDGTVGKVRVTQHLSKELDAAAVKAVKQWRFKPGTKNGKVVPVETNVEMTFALR